MNTHTLYFYEHLQENKQAHHLKIGEVAIDVFVVDGTSPLTQRTSLKGLNKFKKCEHQC